MNTDTKWAFGLMGWGRQGYTKKNENLSLDENLFSHYQIAIPFDHLSFPHIMSYIVADVFKLILTTSTINTMKTVLLEGKFS